MQKKLKRNRDEHIYFQDSRFTVTDRNLKTPRKTYRIANLEKIGLRRDPFYFALALSVMLFGFLLSFNDYLYNGERIVLLLVPAALLFGSFRMGILFVESKALAEMAALAPITTLQKVREAVEDAIDDFHENAEAQEDND